MKKNISLFLILSNLNCVHSVEMDASQNLMDSTVAAETLNSKKQCTSDGIEKKSIDIYKTVSAGSLFDRMMSADGKVSENAQRQITDTGRLTAVTYRLCAAEIETIKSNPICKKIIEKIEQINQISTQCAKASKDSIDGCGSASAEQILEKLCKRIAPFIKENDIIETVQNLYQALGNYKHSEIKDDLKKIASRIEEDFEIGGPTFLRTIQGVKDKDRNNQTLATEKRAQQIDHNVANAGLTITQIQLDIDKIAKIIKHGFDYAVQLHSDNLQNKIIEKYVTGSKNKSKLSIVGRSNRSDVDNNLSAIFFHNKEENIIDINCIGTHSLTDWLYNLDVFKSKGNIFTGSGFGQEMHAGFSDLAGYALNEFNKSKEIQTLITSGAKIRVAGHSLGGAMGQILAVNLRKIYGERVSLLTFCQPAAYSASDAEKVSSAFSGDFLRVYNQQDVVPVSLFNPGAVIGQQWWYDQAGISIAVKQDFWTLLSNLNPLKSHSIDINVTFLPQTLTSYILKHQKPYEIYKKSFASDKKKENAFKNLNCFKIKKGKYIVEHKKDSKVPEKRKEVSEQWASEEFKNIQALNLSPYLSVKEDTAAKITDFATVALKEIDNVPGGDVGTFVRDTLQTLNKHVSKSKRSAEYQEYRSKIIEALRHRLNKSSEKMSQDTLLSIAHLYKKDFKNLKIDTKKIDMSIVEKSISKIRFLEKQLTRLKKELDLQNAEEPIDASALAPSDDNIKDITDTIENIEGIVKSSNEALYYACNDALSEMIKSDTHNKKSPSVIFARAFLKLGVKLDAYHYTKRAYGYTGFQKSVNNDAEKSLRELMGYYQYREKMIHNEVKKLKDGIESNKIMDNDNFDGISDNESDGDN